MFRLILLIILLLHSLLHFLGFFKAYHIAELAQLKQEISKSAGNFWLTAFLLFAITMLLVILKNEYWWLIALVALIVSQVLIFGNWSDTKFGSAANLLILIACVVGFANWNFKHKYLKEVKSSLEQKKPFLENILSDADIASLPEPVKNYIRQSGCIGKAKVNSFKVTFEGTLRKDDKSEWMNFSSEQYNFMQTPTRLFFMKAAMKNLPVIGFHCFKNGRAYMDIRLFSLFKVQYQDGGKMDTAETVTFFNDMCCLAPATLIDKRIQWLLTDSNTVDASFTNNNITITAKLFFNEKGELVNFISNDRFNIDENKQIPWSTPLYEYKNINGYHLMSNAETIYTYPDKDFCYGTFRLTVVEYNPSAN